jgi:hypothetical protein
MLREGATLFSWCNNIEHEQRPLIPVRGLSGDGVGAPERPTPSRLVSRSSTPRSSGSQWVIDKTVTPFGNDEADA